MRSSSLQRAALEICAGVIAHPAPEVAEISDRDTLITTPWLHPEMHEPVPALPVHAIVTYYGSPAPRTWRIGKQTLSGTGMAGRIGIVPAGWHGQWDIMGDASVSYVFLSDARFQKFAAPFARRRRVDVVPRVGEADPVGAHLLEALTHEAAHPEPSGRLFVEQLLDLLCMHVLRKHSSLEKPPALIPSRGLAPWQVRRVTAHMSANLDRQIGLDELCGLISLSRSHFCTAFRQATGRTPHEWLTRRRIDHAQTLLLDLRLPIGDVAFAVGYQTASAFTAAFRREVGITPSQYRRCL